MVERHSEEHLSPEVLHKFLHSFTKSTWIENFSKFDNEQRQELTQIWQTILIDEHQFYEQERFFESFKLSSIHKDDFYLKMNALYGKQWLEDIRYTQMIDMHFDAILPHLLKHRHIFSEALNEFESINEYQSRSLFNI